MKYWYLPAGLYGITTKKIRTLVKFGASCCIYLWVFLIVVVMNCEYIYEIIPSILTGELSRVHGECFFL